MLGVRCNADVSTWSTLCGLLALRGCEYFWYFHFCLCASTTSNMLDRAKRNRHRVRRICRMRRVQDSTDVSTSGAGWHDRPCVFVNRDC